MKAPRFSLICLAIAFLVLGCWQMVQAALAITVSPASGPPTTKLTVKGSSFGVSEAVDVYFDTQDRFLALTDGTGKFTCAFPVLKDALPGTHWVTAVGRKSGAAAQKSFLVRTNWSQFRFNYQRRGYNPYENVLSPSNVGDLNEWWLAGTGGPIWSSPAVANGVVYVGSDGGRMWAFDAKTGAVRWGLDTGNPIDSSPAVANGVVYFGSADWKVWARFPDGSTKTFSTGGEVHSSPLVIGGFVYVGSDDGNLYCLAASDLDFQWFKGTGGAIRSSPALYSGLIIFGSSDGKVRAVHGDGSPAWEFPTGGEVRCTPAVVNGIVYVGSDDGHLYLLDAYTGAKIRDLVMGSAIRACPAVGGRYVYVRTQSKLYALDAYLVQRWSLPVGASLSSPTLANGVVYIGDMGYLYALDALSGIPLWYASLGSSVASSPAVADGWLYVGSADWDLRAYRLNPGICSQASAPRPDPARLVPDLSLQPQSQ